MNRCEYCNVSCGWGADDLSAVWQDGRTRRKRKQKQAQSYPAYGMESREEEPKSVLYIKSGCGNRGRGGHMRVDQPCHARCERRFWCLDIAVIFGYIWLLVLNTVRPKIRGSVKLMLQAGIISLMLCVFDWNAGRGLWSVNYAIPIAVSRSIFW